jgi:uncharacterized protein (TIGR03435 family)
VDERGIKGRYEMTINFTLAPAVRDVEPLAAGGEPVATEPDGTISVFEAVSKQPGLKLQPRKVKTAVLVVDHVNETPTEN